MVDAQEFLSRRNDIEKDSMEILLKTVILKGCQAHSTEVTL